MPLAFETYKETNRSSESAEIIKEVLILQRKCNQFVTETSEDFLADLYQRGLLKIGRNEKGEIMATLYQLPLDTFRDDNDVEQVFRIGGLATQLNRESTKVLLGILKELEEEIREHDKKIIATTGNKVLARYLISAGLEEIGFEECREKYRRYIDLYLTNSKKSEEAYSGKKFYIANLQE